MLGVPGLVKQRAVVVLPALWQHDQQDAAGDADRCAERARPLAGAGLDVELHVALGIQVDAEAEKRRAQGRKRPLGGERGVELRRAPEPAEVGRSRIGERHPHPASQLCIDVAAIEVVRRGQEPARVLVQGRRGEAEPLVQLQHRRGLQVVDEVAAADGDLLVEGIQPLRGDVAAGGVQPQPALAVGLVDQARAHLAVGHLGAVHRDDECRLGVGHLLAQVLDAVPHVGLAGEAVELGRGVACRERSGLRKRGQVGVALVHRRDLEGGLVPGRVQVVLLHRLGRHLLEPPAIGIHGGRHLRPYTNDRARPRP